MTLILELKGNKEAALKAKAQSQGVSPERFAEEAVNRALEEDPRSVWDIFAESRKRLPPRELAQLPSDGADEHDHYLYLYGQPKQNQ